MPSERDAREAYRVGVAEGCRLERKRLRTFVGTSWVAPEHSRPEHLAYADYEQSLLAAIKELSAIITAEEQNISRLQANADEAQEAFLAAAEEHELSSSFFGKLKALLTGSILPEQKIANESLDHLRERRQLLDEDKVKLAFLDEESGSVTLWLDEMYRTTAEQGQRRARDRAAEALDISARNFQTYLMSEFLEEDERRRLGWAPEFPGGTDFGYHWRRDGDDSNAYGRVKAGKPGNWRAVWIPATKETAVFIDSYDDLDEPARVWLFGTHIQSRDAAMQFFMPLEPQQNRRNSLALLMDAYTEKYLEVRTDS
jgi:hypothetical protein